MCGGRPALFLPLDSIDLAVRTSGPEDQTFCPSDEGCALYAYYHEIIDDDPYKFFTTSCQASEGTKAYVGSVEDEGSSDDDNLETASLASASTRATTAFAVTACIELPKNVSVHARVKGRGVWRLLVFTNAVEIFHVIAPSHQFC